MPRSRRQRERDPDRASAPPSAALALAADSLREATGRVIDRNVLAGMILNRLDHWVRTYEARGLIRSWTRGEIGTF